MNNFGRGRMVSILLTITPMVEVVALFVTIKWHEIIPLSGFFVFPLIFIFAFVGLVLFETVAGQVFLRSWILIRKLRGGCRTAQKRKELAFLRPLKVQFASNFIDKATALATQDFCINQTVSLLLMYK